MEIVERFINYTKFDTQSAEDSQTVPSTPKQLVFAKYLKEELEHEGMKEVEMDEMGYIYATLPANTKKKIHLLCLKSMPSLLPLLANRNREIIARLTPTHCQAFNRSPKTSIAPTSVITGRVALIGPTIVKGN